MLFKNILVNLNGATRCLKLEVPEDVQQLRGEVLFELVEKDLGVPSELQRLRLNGRELLFEDEIDAEDFIGHDFSTLAVLFRLDGGKGGFGCLLRGQKGARKKVTNFDACRALNGRRVRHAKAVERLKTWLEKKRHDDALVEALGGGESTESVQPVHQTECLTNKFVEQQNHTSEAMSNVVIRGLAFRSGSDGESGRQENNERSGRLANLNAVGFSDDESFSEDEQA
eukprot:Selendium_serpulae@DN6190_c0_g1_i2.p1